MKRFILMFTAIMFLANAFAVSAWAKPCVNMNEPLSMAQAMDMGDMPCHDAMKDGQDEKKIPTKHCDGVCLCFHASINQTPVLNNQAGLDIPLGQSERLIVKNERVASMATAPLRRPPKHIS
ncbi:MAG: hypothetical protein GC137_10380 [Alphaproteobacteria bacterium]|nr:hypothetical protein [Alphaproteobacteria bacterium]